LNLQEGGERDSTVDEKKDGGISASGTPQKEGVSCWGGKKYDRLCTSQEREKVYLLEGKKIVLNVQDVQLRHFGKKKGAGKTNETEGRRERASR